MRRDGTDDGWILRGLRPPPSPGRSRWTRTPQSRNILRLRIIPNRMIVPSRKILRLYEGMTVICAIVCVLLQAGVGMADMIVSIPNTQAPQGGRVTVPVEVSQIAAPGIIAYQFTMSYSAAVLQFSGVSTDGTMTESWPAPMANEKSSGSVTIGAYNATPIAGEGQLVKVEFDVLGNLFDLTYLSFDKFMADDGSIGVQTFGGDVVVVQADAVAVSDLSIAIENGTSLRLSWSPEANAVEYDVYRGSTPFFEPVTPVARISTTTYLDAGRAGDPNENYYYVVKSLNAYSESNVSNRVGEFDFALVTTPTTDFNEIALPLIMPGIQTASDLMQAIPNCNSVAMWNTQFQGYRQYSPSIPSTNFDVYPGYPYYVNVSAPGVFTMTGSYSQPQFELLTTATTDFNDIIIPLVIEDLAMASDLMASIPNCNSVARWNAPFQGYSQYSPSIPSTNFMVRTGYPYYVNVSSNGVWPTEYGSVFSAASLTKRNQGVVNSTKVPHLVYGEIESHISSGIVRIEAWLNGVDRLTDDDFGCGYDHRFFWIQCAQFRTSWQEGDKVNITIYTKDYDTGYEVVLTSDAHDLAAPSTGGRGRVDAGFTLHQNYPNPFNASTSIAYSLERDGWVRLEVYNIMGQRVRTLVDERLSIGRHRVIWDSTEDRGPAVTSGIYWYRLCSDDRTEIKKMIYMR